MDANILLVFVFANAVQGWFISSSSPEPGRVCFTSLGRCYSNAAPYNNVPGFLPESPAIQQVQFWLYTRGDTNRPQTISADSDASITTSNFDAHRETKVIIHGFGEWGNKSWVRIMKDTILTHDNVNVIIVNWREGAKPPVYFQSVANTRVVGTLLEKLITRLNTVTRASFQSFHLIGHSLGAHVAGYAGMTINTIGRITGMDPAGPNFDDFGNQVILDASDASFVDIIHTNAKPLRNFGYGIQKTTGHVDFFPNGGVNQPGCPDTTRGILLLLNGDTAAAVTSLACSHERGFVYFIASINGTLFEAYPCASKSAYQRGLCRSCDSGCAYMGYYADETSPRGTFYLSTGSDWIQYPQDTSMGVLAAIN
ncbi:pancreatic triacylglycerol lipase-like [Haliotis cracherodii]|uniref:pancreatic triacylglycerol lipase-like n=1 Tax=Haliotis cracherodii TaxID=6455 RepID=UPI0039E94910